MAMRILVAGWGNVLRQDDGFGVVVAQRLLDGRLPEQVRVMDVGIGGIHMVQALFEPTDGLIVLDAVDLGRHPGTVVVIEPDVMDVASLPLIERHDQLADMHYATPSRAFMLARALEILPPATWLVGCQPVDAQSYGEGLSAEVERAVETAIVEVKTLVASLGVSWR